MGSVILAAPHFYFIYRLLVDRYETFCSVWQFTYQLHCSTEEVLHACLRDTTPTADSRRCCTDENLSVKTRVVGSPMSRPSSRWRSRQEVTKHTSQII